MKKFEYLIVLLDNSATSFCYYDNPSYSKGNSNLISLELLKRIIKYANKKSMYINYLYPKQKLPEAYDKLIEKDEHINILPIELRNKNNKAIYVINPDKIKQIKSIPINANLNLILRLPRQKIKDLSEIFELLIEKCQRLNLILLDIESFKQEELDIYAQQLVNIQKIVTGIYQSGRTVEINFVSDCILLTQMNNCDAGTKHLTFAPNGKFYLCPAFYHQNSENSVGDLANGIEIINEQLLHLDHAPICRNCDAFHCKRCVFLNKLITNEFNTPSHEQCVISHLERNTSKYVLDNSKPLVKEFEKHENIPDLDYLDPFEFVIQKPKESLNKNQGQTHIDGSLKSFEKMTDREILFSIYQMQKEILNKLPNK